MYHASSPNFTRHLTADDFADFKSTVEAAYAHIIGEEEPCPASATPGGGGGDGGGGGSSRAGSAGTSRSPRTPVSAGKDLFLFFIQRIIFPRSVCCAAVE